jgi:Na+-transporting methylmalonyl-CoA/oxaloacetate decarboxylase gamma subunit
MSDTTTLTEAAVLTGVGMAVVFAALVLLMLAVVVLRRVMQGRGDSEEGNGTAPGATESVGPSKESIAAMAVGLALLMEGSRVAPAGRSGGGAPTIGTGASPWVRVGRDQQMRSRRKVGHKWGRRSR